ncbi:thiamine phosphate synthase [Candidatus Pelagibacter sp. RS39]|uniref:thiamine phosphate synthase n=1 Tax=Candidatus Pelagibacter sp. RS39 TaxID=1977864 RepID=UPI0028F3E3CC|nr:thiamine phosphate synthase [Candidatus Pelagibacter sp. RS39]
MLRANGLKNLRINRKKFIYLISPIKIYKSFYQDLIMVLQQKKVSFFQLRLKKGSRKKKLIVGRKIMKICKRFNVKFLINDDVFIAKKLNADGCHLGQKDMNIIKARKLIGNKIIGVTCHNSIKLSKIAVRNKADYIALGAFNNSKTKKIKYRASINLLRKVKKITKTPVVAIGGINSSNYKNLLLNKANFLAISGYIWNNDRLKPIEAIKILK